MYEKSGLIDPPNSEYKILLVISEGIQKATEGGIEKAASYDHEKTKKEYAEIIDFIEKGCPDVIELVVRGLSSSKKYSDEKGYRTQNILNALHIIGTYLLVIVIVIELYMNMH